MVGAHSTFGDVVAYVISLIDITIPVLATLALVLFFVGVVRYIAKSGDAHGKTEERQIILWGLVALFVIFSIWGILRVLNNTLLGGGGSGDPWEGLRNEDIYGEPTGGVGEYPF